MMSKRKLDYLGVSAFCESMAMMVQAGIQTDEAIALLQSGKELSGGVLEQGLQVMKEQVEQAKRFGHNIGIIFQIRDDIFDYFDSKEIGKPTGNDMAEGKLTLPVIYALNTHPMESMLTLARKVKGGTVNADEIAVLVDYAKESGGIEYAERQMERYARDAQEYIDHYVSDSVLKEAFTAYLEFVVQRNN